MSDYLDHIGKIKTEQNVSLFNDVKLTNIGRLVLKRQFCLY